MTLSMPTARLLGIKRTSLIRSPMSANDPKQTWPHLMTEHAPTTKGIAPRPATLAVVRLLPSKTRMKSGGVQLLTVAFVRGHLISQLVLCGMSIAV